MFEFNVYKNGIKSCIGICFKERENPFSKKTTREAFYYNPESKDFCREATDCWFPAKKLAEVRLEFMGMILGQSFQKFLEEK